MVCAVRFLKRKWLMKVGKGFYCYSKDGKKLPGGNDQMGSQFS